MAVLSKVANIAVQPQPVGVVEAFAGSNAPNGWLICDGSQVSRALYPELYSVIGTTYGSGDGFSTFTLPDLRGRTIAGRDGVNNMNNGPTNRLTSTHFGASGTALGNSGGSESNTLSTAQMPSHTHTQDAHSHQVRVNSFAGDRQIACGPLGADGDKYSFTDSGNDASTSTALLYAASSTGTNQNTGGGGAHNNTQPTIILNYIIKAVSELPRGGWYNSSSPDLVTSLPTNPYVGQEVYHSVNAKIYPKRYNGSSWDEFSINTSSLPAGSIVQMGRYGWTNETSVNGSGAGWVNATNSSYTFTPQFSNSTILIQFEWAMAPYNTGGQYTGMSCRGLWAGNVVTVQGANGGATHEVYFANAASNGADLYTRTVKSASFTSNTTSPTIITTQVAAYVGTTNARLNQNANWPSYYTVWEIKG